MILIDANIFMYTVGRDSPQREPCRVFLDQATRGVGTPCCTDSEVLQEILHRYRATSRPDVGYQLFDAVVDMNLRILPIGEPEVRRARRLLEAHGTISARDAVHIGVMEANGITEVLTYDQGFDAVPWVRRREP